MLSLQGNPFIALGLGSCSGDVSLDLEGMEEIHG